VTIRVDGPIIVKPPEFFLGLLEPGAEEEGRVTLTSAAAFEIKDIVVQGSQALTAKPTRTGETAWVVDLTCKAPQGASEVQGTVVVSTDMPEDPEVRIPFFAGVVE
jgi:hypothetical protein